MNKSLFFVLLAAVLILGCTSASGPAGPGLTIREFSFSPASLTGAQKTSLSLVVQNTGSMDVKEAYAKIFGFGKESGLWNVATACEGCGTGDKNTEAKIPLLRAQSSFAGNVGEQKKFVWLLQNNDNIPEDMARSYTANARLCYPYKTTALGRVELMSENEWMSKNSPQHEIIVSQTSAPVRITVLSKQPIISSGRLSLDLLIENVGGGTVASDGYCKYNFGDSDKPVLEYTKFTQISEPTAIKTAFKEFSNKYFDVVWDEAKLSHTIDPEGLTEGLTDTENSVKLTLFKEDGTSTWATPASAVKATVTLTNAQTTKSYNLIAKYEDGKLNLYDDSASSRLNRLNLEISGLTKEICTTSVGTSNNIFLEKGKSVKVSADCGIGSESAPISAADLKIEMEYNYYVDAKATVGVKGPVPLILPLIVSEDTEKIVAVLENIGDKKEIEFDKKYTMTCNSEGTLGVGLYKKLSDPSAFYTTQVYINLDTSRMNIKSKDGRSAALPIGKQHILKTNNQNVYFTSTNDCGITVSTK